MPREWDEHGNLVTTGPAKREWDERGNLITGAAPSPHEGGMPAGTMQAQPGGPLFHYTKPQDLWSTTKRQVGGGLEAIGELGKGLGQTVLGAAKAYVGGPQEGAQFAQSMIAPQQAQFQRGRETTGLESAGHYLAGATPFVGPMAAEAGESIGRGEVGRGLVYGAAAIGPEKIVSMMRPAVDLVRTGDAITNGMTRLAKEQVRPTLDKFEGAVKAEVSRHADAVVNADEARGARGSRILVNTEDAAKAAEAKAATMKGFTMSEKTKGFITDARGGAQVMPPNTVPGSLAHIKEVATDLSNSIGGEMRRGNAQDAAVQETLYKGLQDAMQKHATDMGEDYGKSWKQYRDVHAARMERLKGLMGDLREGFVGPDTISKLVHPDSASQFHQLVSEMKDYGVDTRPIESAREYGFKLQDTLQQTSNLFLGKLRAMIKYPLAAGATAIGASELARLSGIPGMSFALPLIAAGKVARILDLRQMRILLNDINEAKLRAGSPAPESLASPYKRELPPPLKPPSGLQTPDVPGGEPEMERLRRAPAKPAPEAEAKAPTTEEERAKEKAEFDRRFEETRKSQEAIDEGEARRELAGKLKGARKRKGIK